MLLPSRRRLAICRPAGRGVCRLFTPRGISSGTAAAPPRSSTSGRRRPASHNFHANCESRSGGGSSCGSGGGAGAVVKLVLVVVVVAEAAPLICNIGFRKFANFGEVKSH